MGKKRKRRGFTLIELMVVILIVGILAAVAVPILRGKIEQAKWSEGAATAGAIRSAARARFAEAGAAGVPVGAALTDATAATLGFQSGDLTGRYFSVGNFTISSISAEGIAVVAVAAPAGLTGSGTLNSSGWTYTPPP
jgi:type IV pilus assembly protein PilA